MIEKICVFFPLLFIIELVFGGSGTLIMFKGTAIRHILFILTFVSLYGYMLYDMIRERMPIYSKTRRSYLGDFSKTDIFAVIFELSMLLSMTVIPYVMGTSLQYAKSEVFDSAAIFSLYFALTYLIKRNLISFEKFLVFLKYVICMFGIEHIVLYFGQELNANFIESFFEKLVHLFGGNGLVPRVILGHGGYTRVMFNTSIYFLVGFFIFFYYFNKNKWYDYVIFAIELTAMITTVTKSIWLGAGIAFFAIIIVYFIYGMKINKKMAYRAIGTVAFTVIFVFAMDGIVFDDIVKIRMTNAFVTEVETVEDGESAVSQEEISLEELDKAGAAESNSIKIEQMWKLLDRWKTSPIIGYGYGSYVEGYLRSEEAPFSYEMQLPALLMKIGIAGLLIWICFFVIQFIEMIYNRKREWIHVFAWLFLLTSLVICVQTNPLLISFTGMSILLFLSIVTTYENR